MKGSRPGLSDLSMLGLVALVILAIAACSGGGGSEAAGDTLTRSERDSVIGESSLPGAGGVRSAREASDVLRERAAQIDSAGSR